MNAHIEPQRAIKALWQKSRRFPFLVIAIVVAFIFVAIFAPWLTPYDPYTHNLTNRLMPPGATHWLGTDSFGRDLMTRLFFGARVTLIVIAAALGTGAIVGVTLGILAGYFGGAVDSVISRTIDALLAFPTIFFGLLLAVTMGPSLRTVVIAVSLVVWARFARVIRAEVLLLREKDFIAQARVNGCSGPRIILVHIVPNIVSAAMVMVSINVGIVVLLEAVLSFLGAGIPPPIPSWGSMIAEGQEYVASAWWIAVVPGVAIMLLVLAVSLLGDWLRDFLDPRRQ